MNQNHFYFVILRCGCVRVFVRRVCVNNKSDCKHCKTYRIEHVDKHTLSCTHSFQKFVDCYKWQQRNKWISSAIGCHQPEKKILMHFKCVCACRRANQHFMAAALYAILQIDSGDCFSVQISFCWVSLKMQKILSLNAICTCLCTHVSDRHRRR